MNITKHSRKTEKNRRKEDEYTARKRTRAVKPIARRILGTNRERIAQD
jgi:hypothetical protein